ncbi:DUF3054 family protein [Actinomyces capricornis]|uniref:DUF3054 domain-containing protein n=1 Tax=Actinomyces capricornis TaxID=2755559 RepID=A0ABM7UDB0_9ACTO|nr:DUF3054 family protein [Actinomyces capricornis]BDA65145.1 hypothetical protein MANAM107_19790 [Actinomyces capricornis]
MSTVDGGEGARVVDAAPSCAPGGPPARRITFTPALPDGADCPWTRERRTRWWLVLPSDVVAVALVALFGAAATRTLDALATPLWQAMVAVVVGWLVAWLLRRCRPDHLEAVAPDGLIVIAAAWCAWSGLHLAVGGAGRAGSWMVMTGAFLLAFLGGWRWLYGYVRAHDCLVPAPLARRMAAQEEAERAGGAG